MKKNNNVPEEEVIPAPPKAYLDLPDQDEILLPNMDIAYAITAVRHARTDGRKEDEDKEKEKLFKMLNESKAATLIETVSKEFDFACDEAKIQEYRNHATEELKMIEQARAYCEQSLGDSEVRDQMMRKAHFLCETCDFTGAIAAYEESLTKPVGTSGKLHVTLTLIRIAFFQSDFGAVKDYIKRAKDILSKGGDWERRNKLKVYEGLYFVTQHNFQEATRLFVDACSTYTASEVVGFDKFVLYAICVAMLFENRKSYKSNILTSPDVLQVCVEDTTLSNFMSSVYQNDYHMAFRTLVDIYERLRVDFYFAPHINLYIRKFRIFAYNTFLKAFDQVKLSSMAEKFGVSEEFIEKEISMFIGSGLIPCKIDRVKGIVFAHRGVQAEAILDNILEEGEALHAKIQKLSAVMYL